MDEIVLSDDIGVGDAVIKKIDIIHDPQIDRKFYEVDQKTIDYLKRYIRSSYEYKTLVMFLKSIPEFSSCVFHRNFSFQNGLPVEIHHEPFTITDIIKTTCEKQLKLNKFFTERSIGNEVMENHYSFKVGLVPLCPTCHELVHSKKLKISPESILTKGWVDWFEENYPYHDDLVVEKYEDVKDNKKNLNYPEIVSKKKQLIVSDKVERLTNAECKKMLIDSKIDDLEVIR